MTVHSDNCIVCAQEFSLDELNSIALSAVNVTRFKICNKCLNQTDPQDDYREVRDIVNAFLSFDNTLKK